MASVKVAVPMPAIVTVVVPVSFSQKPRLVWDTVDVFPENEIVTKALVKDAVPSVPEAVSDSVYVIDPAIAEVDPPVIPISRMTTATTGGNLKQCFPIYSPLLSFSWNVGLRSQFLYGLCLRTQFWFQVNLLAGHEVSLGTAVPYCKCLHMNEKRFPLCTGCQVHNRLPIMSVSRACLTSARPESSFRNLGLSAPTSVNSNDHSRSDLAASSANSSCLPPTFLSTTARRIHRENAEHFENK